MEKHSPKKYYSETTGKIHIPCPHNEETGVNTHVVLKSGYCYRSESCMIIKCKFNNAQSDIKNLLSMVW